MRERETVKSQIGEVIATRVVTDGAKRLLIEVGKPGLGPDSGTVCPFRIQDWGESSAVGADAIAALYCALADIGEVLARANDDGHAYTVVGPTHLGFPSPQTDRVTQSPVASYALGELIAIRTLSTADGPRTIAIGRPLRAADGEFYLCPFRIDGHPHAIASGQDDIQALLTVLRMIGAWLHLPADWPLSRVS
ncbi:DUF6968 family protein [Nocardia sp. NPDC006044]|uniref:DUF6968 family protein n=1 Tax=Nocardia sp. NPDC006044 TaxID=3364306 RepID=UPI00369A938B